MAQLLLIQSTVEADDRQVGDIVDIFDDSDSFAQREKDNFNVVKADGSVAAWAAKLPRIYTKEFWQDGDDLKEIVTRPRFTAKWDGKDIVHTFDRYTANDEKQIASTSTNEG